MSLGSVHDTTSTDERGLSQHTQHQHGSAAHPFARQVAPGLSVGEHYQRAVRRIALLE
jgi:hypothetical protein